MFKNYDPDFKPFFENRLAAKIETLGEQADVMSLYDGLFKKVLYSGALTIAAILVLIFLINGSLSFDSLLGVKQISVENAMAMSLANI